jgi:hypothetical protein
LRIRFSFIVEKKFQAERMYFLKKAVWVGVILAGAVDMLVF